MFICKIPLKKIQKIKKYKKNKFRFRGQVKDNYIFYDYIPKKKQKKIS